MISGVMPMLQRWVHYCACGFVCLVFAGLGVVAAVPCAAGLMGAGTNPVAYVLFASPMLALTMAAIVSQVRSLKTLVREFSYDGRLIRFRTITSSEEQVRGLHEIKEIRQGGTAGHWLLPCLLRRPESLP